MVGSWKEVIEMAGRQKQKVIGEIRVVGRLDESGIGRS